MTVNAQGLQSSSLSLECHPHHAVSMIALSATWWRTAVPQDQLMTFEQCRAVYPYLEGV
jgi:hypothetical protein